MTAPIPRAELAELLRRLPVLLLPRTVNGYPAGSSRVLLRLIAAGMADIELGYVSGHVVCRVVASPLGRQTLATWGDNAAR